MTLSFQQKYGVSKNKFKLFKPNNTEFLIVSVLSGTMITGSGEKDLLFPSGDEGVNAGISQKERTTEWHTVSTSARLSINSAHAIGALDPMAVMNDSDITCLSHVFCAIRQKDYGISQIYCRLYLCICPYISIPALYREYILLMFHFYRTEVA